MTLKRSLLVYSALLMGLVGLSNCGRVQTRAPSSSESLPNEMAPLTATVDDYLPKPTRSIQEKICHDDLNEGDLGQIQICCSPSVEKNDVSKQPLEALDLCESSFERKSASCAISTVEGTMKGRLWSCPAAAKSSAIVAETPGETRGKSGPFDFLKKRTDPELRDPDPVTRMDSIDLISAPLPEKKLKTATIDPAALVAPVYYELASEAEILGKLPTVAYLKFQTEYMGNTRHGRTPACNFFLITSLCMSGYCQDRKPMFNAADFDTYFYKTGWDLIKLPELKQMYRDKRRFDAVFQVEPRVRGRPGHVAIPIGLDENDRVIIAQGNLNVVTNEIKSVSDELIKGFNGRGFNIFVKREKLVSDSNIVPDTRVGPKSSNKSK